MLSDSVAAPNLKEVPKPHQWRGVTLSIEEARECYEQSDYHQSAKILREVIEFAPNEREAWQLLGEALIQLGENSEAEICLERHINLEQTKRSSERYPLSLRLAKILWAQDEHKTARSMLAVLILRDPDNQELLELKDHWIELMRQQQEAEKS
ncbi:MAG: tetratricopeptide repeat protein [Zetaproteobacteria bacterium]|nr:tetratricopeptide repeat protein [Zetaproteobacteria bacterium]